MTDQLALALNDPQDVDTSALAAALERHAIAARVIEVLRLHPKGLTDWELTELCGLPPEKKPTVGKRRQEDAKAVLVRDLHGVPVTRPSPSGQRCKVWCLPQFSSTARPVVGTVDASTLDGAA